MKVYRVYVIRNSEGRLYIGLSEDVAHRLEQHNAGESKWTAKFGPWDLEWTSGEMKPGDVRRLENRMKCQKGGRGLDQLMDEHQGS